MKSFEKIRKYINSMRIRKAVIGGYDREDVFLKMNKLVDVLREYVKEDIEAHEEQKNKIENEIKQYQAEIESYKQKLQESQVLIEELNLKLDELTAEKASTMQEMESLKDTYKNYCSNIIEQYSGSLRVLSTGFSKILENITTLQQNIVEFDDVESIKFIESSMGAIEDKELLELPHIGIDVDEWLYGDEDKRE